MFDTRNVDAREYRDILYVPIQGSFFLILIGILGILLSLLFINVVGVAFKNLFPTIGPLGILLILATCLIGSYVNIPIKRYKSLHPTIRMGYVTAFGVTYPIPSLRIGLYETLLAINIGGAIVPTATSAYLMAKSTSIIPNIVVATAIVAIIVKSFSRPVKGAGIIVPALIPPLAAASVGILLGGGYPHIVAYVSGTIGTLIGADLLNLHKIPQLGAPIVSIGGAGAFDGIFLAGIMAVLIAF